AVYERLRGIDTPDGWKSPIRFFDTVVGREFGRIDSQGFEGPGAEVNPALPVMSSQDLLMEILRAAAAATDLVEFRFGHQVTELTSGAGDLDAEAVVQVVDETTGESAVTGKPFTIGRFTLTALPARHSPGDLAPSRIDRPLSPPARATDYRTGDCHTLHVRHGERELLVHASTHSLPGALDGRRADTVYLGIGALGKQDEAFREEYWDRLVTGTGARRVVPVHWDDSTRPLDGRCGPSPPSLTTSRRP
ncbi:hypothetical protein ACWD25_42910, partial [Streptomyces sp. NPDC002920]